MSRKKKLQHLKSVQREIARRLQAGLPLAGMIAATTLLCGCHEHSENFPAGSVPRDPDLCEQQHEQPRPKTPEETTSEIDRLINELSGKPNNINEVETRMTNGLMPRSERENITKSNKAIKELASQLNQKNETVDPASTRGRFPSMKKDK